MTDYCEVVTGEVTDILAYDEAEDHVVPQAALFHWHPGQELVILNRYPHPGGALISNPPGHPLYFFLHMVNRLWDRFSPGWPSGRPLVLVPADSVEIGESIEVRAARVVDPTAAGADHAALVYRAASVGGVGL